MFSVTKPQQYAATADTRSLDSVSTTRVCRVCLSVGVKMYQMSEHKLSVMYEQVTGVVINTEDVLPRMLCWECVARLSSAHCFLERALKTHWLLVKDLKCSKIVTINDIKSIDRARHQLISTLGFKYNKENCSDFHIVEDSDKIYENQYDKENFNGCEDTEKEYCELNDIDLNNEEEETIITTEVIDDKDPIKIEYFDVDEEQNLDYIRVISDEKDQITIHDLDARLSIKESTSDEEEIDNVKNEMCNDKNQTLEVRELCEEIKPRCKELRVVLEDIMIILSKHNTQDMFKQLVDTDESSNEDRTICHPPINTDILVKKNNDVQKMTLNKDTTEGKYKQSTLETKTVSNPVTADITSTVID